MKWIVICLIITFASGSLAQNCTAQTTCTDCTALNNCGWCAPTWQCLEGTASGPNAGKCQGSAWEFSKCTDCKSLSNCRSCLDYSTDCWWCANTTSCWPYGPDSPKGCPRADSCPCSVYSTCSSCTLESRGNCFFCGDDNTCKKNGDNCGLIRHSCPCSDQPDCSSCAATAGCHWCVDTGTCENTATSTCPIPVTGCDGYCKKTGMGGCAVCSSLPGCGWCTNPGECRDVNYATCSIAHTCSTCEQYDYCNTCFNDLGCTWCSKEEKCKPKGTGCLTPHNCDVYCGTFTTCELCIMRKGCGWCGDSKACVNADTTNCLLSHSCTTTQIKKAGFSAGSFVGGMFLVIGILALALVGYFVYRWKVNRRPAYTELK